MNEVWMFVSYAAALFGQLGDCYTTEVGLTNGLAEGNGVAKWITGKIGNTGITLLKCVGFAQVFPAAAYFLGGHSVGLWVAAASVAAAEGFAATIMNYLLLKKNKISLGL